MKDHPNLPPVIYVLRSMTVPRKYPGSALGHEWVARWRAVHLRTAAAADASQPQSVIASIEAIYRNAGHQVPETVHFERGDRSFLQRVLLELSDRPDVSARSVESLLSQIEKEQDALHHDLLRTPMSAIETAIARALRVDAAPSSREVFGEHGADLSAAGIRMDPVVESIRETIQTELDAIARRIEGVMGDGPYAESGSLEHRDWAEASPEQLALMLQLAQRHPLQTYGNQSTGLFRLFGYFKECAFPRMAAKRPKVAHVDFARFEPWLHLVRNVQHVFFGQTFVVVNVLPTEVHVSKDRLTRIWKGCGEVETVIRSPWPECFSGQSPSSTPTMRR